MEMLFLKILNMSITAGYVILAVLIIRLLLKRFPKKYSYFLWSVVLFRLVCPVSFSSIFSIFQLRLFDMTTAQREGQRALNYIPMELGNMESANITTGIPIMNSMINETLPEPNLQSSVSPMEKWILIGTILWCIGIAVLLAYSVITYIRLNRRVATAIRLKDNIFESDKIRSPFIFGIFRPRIFIPFGLSEREQDYILRHEEYHLKRKDHLIKLISFGVLVVYWFNPLVWIAFAMMSKDMEMSCDEKVLSETSEDLKREYSNSLLSFAANRRIPVASPLAFGESSIKERIKNVLRFKKPGKGVTVTAIAICALAAAACAANPAKESTDIPEELYGIYSFEKRLYSHGFIQYIPNESYKEYYAFTEDSFVIANESGDRHEIPVSYEKTELDEQIYKDLIGDYGYIPGISKYKKRYQYKLTSESGEDDYRLFFLDDEIWLAKGFNGNNGILYINKIKKLRDGLLTEFKLEAEKQQAEDNREYDEVFSMIGTKEGVEEFLALIKDSTITYENDSSNSISLCYNITPENIKKRSGYSVFKFDISCASFLLYDGEVYPMGEWFGGWGVTSMALCDMNGDGLKELYFTFSFGSGLHRSQVAYFDPKIKQVITFEYAQFSEDMIVTNNQNGGLSLYTADISNMKSPVDFEMRKDKFISDIVYKNGEITLTTKAKYGSP